MPDRNYYSRPYRIGFNNKQRLVIDKFYGVDYNPAQLDVANYHAVDLCNIIHKDNFNQKRNGWEQVLKINPIMFRPLLENNILGEEEENPTNINGVWEIDGVIIAHIGHLLFNLKLGKDRNFMQTSAEPYLQYYRETPTSTVTSNTPKCSIKLANNPSTAFHGYHRLYILDGKKYLCVKTNSDGITNVEYVEDNLETYIPTTTIGITEIDSPINEMQAFEDVNMLTQWRKNKCVSGTYVDDGITLKKTRFTDYQLDTTIIPKHETDLNEITIRISTLKENI